jgi:hypothetical protein
MSDDAITDQPDGATPLDDLSGLLRSDITTRGPLNEAETLNIVSASDWIESGRIRDVFTVRFYQTLHKRMYDEVWSWAGVLRSETGAVPNIGVEPTKVPVELGRHAAKKICCISSLAITTHWYGFTRSTTAMDGGPGLHATRSWAGWTRGPESCGQPTCSVSIATNGRPTLGR